MLYAKRQGGFKSEASIELCASLGLLTREKAERLAKAGIDRFNHNLETSQRFFPLCRIYAYVGRQGGDYKN